MTPRLRAVVYLAATAGFIGLSWWLQTGLAALQAAAVLAALRWLLAAGVLLLGIGIYCRRGSDAVFLGVAGGITLPTGLLLFLLYGGIEDTTIAGADTACNLLMMVWTALPLLFLIRCAVLVAGKWEESRAGRRWLRLAAAGLAVWLAVLLAAGPLLRFVHLEDPDKQETGVNAWIGE